jgi:hypothetical protein
MALTLEDAVTTQSAFFSGSKLTVIATTSWHGWALEVVDSAYWKRQLRVKSAGQRNNSLVIDKGASRQRLLAFA